MQNNRVRDMVFGISAIVVIVLLIANAVIFIAYDTPYKCADVYDYDAAQLSWKIEAVSEDIDKLAEKLVELEQYKDKLICEQQKLFDIDTQVG